MNLNSHNIQIIPEITHLDNNGNKIKTIAYPVEDVIGNDSNIELTLYEKDGTVKDYFQIPFKSWTKNLLLYYFYKHSHTSWVLQDIGGANRTINVAYYPMFTGAANTSGQSIIVGASASAATQSINSFKLAGQITHGTSLGQLTYNAATLDTGFSQVSGSYQYSLFRTFTNNSAGNVNVTEVGLTAIPNGSTAYQFLFARDIVDANGDPINVTVNPTQVLTVKYNLYFPITNGITRGFVSIFLADYTNTTLSTGYVGMGSDKGLLSYPVAAQGHYRYRLNAITAGTAYGGICVGTGSTAFSLDDNKLEWISHGTGSSQQILHGAQTYDGALTYTYSSSGSAAEYTIQRVFTNGGTDPVTIRESALVYNGTTADVNGSGVIDTVKTTVIRTLTGDQVVPSGSSIEMSYKMMIKV